MSSKTFSNNTQFDETTNNSFALLQRQLSKLRVFGEMIRNYSKSFQSVCELLFSVLDEQSMDNEEPFSNALIRVGRLSRKSSDFEGTIKSLSLIAETVKNFASFSGVWKTESIGFTCELIKSCQVFNEKDDSECSDTDCKSIMSNFDHFVKNINKAIADDNAEILSNKKSVTKLATIFESNEEFELEPVKKVVEQSVKISTPEIAYETDSDIESESDPVSVSKLLDDSKKSSDEDREPTTLEEFFKWDVDFYPNLFPTEGDFLNESYDGDDYGTESVNFRDSDDDSE